MNGLVRATFLCIEASPLSICHFVVCVRVYGFYCRLLRSIRLPYGCEWKTYVRATSEPFCEQKATLFVLWIFRIEALLRACSIKCCSIETCGFLCVAWCRL